MEEWTDIRGFPNYSINRSGQIYSKKRNIILKPYHDGWGYPKVSLCNETGEHRKTIHRLTAETFIQNPLNKPEVNHIDGNKNNNKIENLEWVTRSENEKHAFRTGLNVRTSYNAGKEKRKVVIIETGKIFDSITECAKELNCTSGNVISCLQGRTKTCRGYSVEYVN